MREMSVNLKLHSASAFIQAMALNIKKGWFEIPHASTHTHTVHAHTKDILYTHKPRLQPVAACSYSSCSSIDMIKKTPQIPSESTNPQKCDETLKPVQRALGGAMLTYKMGDMKLSHSSLQWGGSDVCGFDLRDLSGSVLRLRSDLQRARSVWLALRSRLFLRRLFRSW